MADTRISQLVLMDSANGLTIPVPSNNLDSADQMIVNDISDINAPTASGTVVTKRAKLGDVLRLINSNLEDDNTGDNSVAGGNLTVEGDLIINGQITDGVCTITDVCEIVTETELQTELNALIASGNTLLCLRDSAPTVSGFDCGIKILGETTIDSDLYVRGVYYGDGGGLTNIQFALRSDSAARSAFSLFALNAGHADSADSADRATISLRAYQADTIRTVLNDTTNIMYPTMVDVTPGVDSVVTDPQLSFNSATNVLTASFFEGDGSLLTNITAETSASTTTKEIDATQTAIDGPHHIMFRQNATGFDSSHTDVDLMFNPVTANIYSTDGAEDTLFLTGGAQYARQTVSIAASGTVYPMMKASLTGRDSVGTSTDLSFDASTGTLSASFFSGNGSSVTNVDAVTATTATNVTVINEAGTNGVFYPNFTSSSSGGAAVSADTQFQYEPDINRLRIAADTGAVTVGADSDFSISYGGTLYSFNVTNNGSSDYVFEDAANVFFPVAENDPVLYLRRGDTYRFDLNASGHPFRIQSTTGTGGTPYITGVTDEQNNGVGRLFFAVPMSAPATLYYQCTNHAAMNGTINVI